MILHTAYEGTAEIRFAQCFRNATEFTGRAFTASTTMPYMPGLEDMQNEQDSVFGSISYVLCSITSQSARMRVFPGTSDDLDRYLQIGGMTVVKKAM